ncbi:Maf family protein [Sphingobacterium sp. Mn56C]|uniref:Maf family protein n=1 Tax=Sphingobacterium sp. Mn56C TaxID=3395261 RepID=UPI003BEB2B2B
MTIEELQNIPIILGSQSPRRKELLASLDLKFEVVHPNVEETISAEVPIASVAEEIAKKKLTAFSDTSYQDRVVITADTVVVDQAGNVLGKPKDFEEAFAVLKGLSGKEHVVYTGVAIAYQGNTISFSNKTLVKFATLDDLEIRYYLDRYKPYDKAGSYGIQEWIGRIGIDYIEGSFENVVGLPTSALYQALKKM